jgi:Transposase DDE domain.
MVKKDRSGNFNKTYLMRMLPVFYQTHLKSQLSLAEYLFVKILINVLQAIKNVSLENLATALPLPILFESRRKKVQRFLSRPGWNIETIWFPIIRVWLDNYFTPGQVIYLVIDRTSWGYINLLMVSVVWDKRAIPIYFELLPKLGNSNLAQQQAALTQALCIFKNYKTVVLGDREFCSVQFANWLRQKHVYFCLRLKKNEFVQGEDEIWHQLNEFSLSPGVAFFLQGVKVTKTRGFVRFNIASKWKRKYLGWTPEEGWFILTNLDSLQAAINAYKQRFDIEEMFRDFKRGGYNLEATNVSGERLISLILLLAIAYSSATLFGQKIKRSGVQKYVGRVKERGRIERRHSSFYIGLYGQTWVYFIEPCQELISQLMRLNLNKRLYYQRGLRAMTLIRSAF